MARRRARGEGSIYKRTRDGRWVAEIVIGKTPAGGKKVLRSVADTRSEVVAWRTARNTERQGGVLMEPTRQTLAQFLEQWLRDVQANTVSARTFESRAGILRGHVIPLLGHIRLSDLTPQDVQGMLARLREAGLTRSTELAYDTLRCALNQALRWGLVPRNVVLAAERPKPPRRQMIFLDPATLGDFLAASRGDRYEALFILAGTTAAREGELLALTWPDFDLRRRTMGISKTLQWRSGGGWYFSDPKSEKSIRTLTLPEVAIEAIEAHRMRQQEERRSLGLDWDPSGFVFATVAGTPVRKSNLTRRSFHPLLAKAGLPRMPFHSLRHSAAVALLTSDPPVDPLVVSELLGHFSVAFTMRTYDHLLPHLRGMASKQMDALYAGRLALAPHNPHTEPLQ